MSHPSKLLKPRRGLWDLELVSQKYLITWSGRTHAPIWWGLLSSPDRQCQNWVECGMPSLYLEGWKIGRYGEKPHIQSQKCSGWAVEKRAFSFHLWITQLLAIYIFLFCVVHFWTTKNYTTKKNGFENYLTDTIPSLWTCWKEVAKMEGLSGGWARAGRYALMLCHLLFSTTCTISLQPIDLVSVTSVFLTLCKSKSESPGSPREFWIITVGDFHTEVWKLWTEIGFEDKGFCECTPHPHRTTFHHFSSWAGCVIVVQSISFFSLRELLCGRLSSCLSHPWGMLAWHPRVAPSHPVHCSSSSPAPEDFVLPRSLLAFLPLHVTSDLVLHWNLSSLRVETVLVFVFPEKTKVLDSWLLNGLVNKWMNTYINEWLYGLNFLFTICRVTVNTSFNCLILLPYLKNECFGVPVVVQ